MTLPFSESGKTPYELPAQPGASTGALTELYESHKVLNGLRVDVRSFGAVCNGLDVAPTDDRLAVQAAIDYVDDLGGGEVFFPGFAYIGSSGGTVTLPGDDGTCPGEATIAAETPGTMPYGLLLPDFVRLVSDHPQRGGIVGPWDGSTINTSQLIGVTCQSAAGRENGLRGVTVQDFFIGFHCRGGTTPAKCAFVNLTFRGCAIPMLTDTLERCRFDRIHMTGCWAGLVNGGQWRFRKNGPVEASWADKNMVGDITWDGPPWGSGSSTLLNRLDAIDTFFDTYFFKTANDATRGGPPAPSDFHAANPFIGICGIPICWMSRYGRSSNSNVIEGPVFSRGAIRAHMLVGHPMTGWYGDHFAEDFGWSDPTTRTSVFGDDRADPWTASIARGLVVFFPIGLTGNFCRLGSIRTEKVNALSQVYSANNRAYSWNGLKNEGSGTLTDPQAIGQFRGALVVEEEITPVSATGVDLGSPTLPFDVGYIENGIRSGEDGQAHAGPTYRANHNPGVTWQSVDLDSVDDMTPDLSIKAGATLVAVSVQRGASRRAGALYCVVGAGASFSVTELVALAGENPSSWNPTLALTVASDGVVTFDYDDGFSSTQSMELIVTTFGVTGFFPT